MITIAESLAADAERLKADIRVLLEQHSRLNPPLHSESIVILGPSHFWADLSVEAQRLQTKILNDYKKYRDLIRVLIRGLTDESQRAFKEANDLILRLVEQDYATWCETKQEATEQTLAAFDRIQSVVDRLYSPDGVSLVVSDTNALVANPNLDHWRFGWCDSFTIVFTPIVLAELDELKISHKNASVREKAESVIRRIKELARRGELDCGVPVLRNTIMARSVAVEPNMSETLPWLDATNNDDRFLASVIEIIRENVRSTVTIVTGDVNLQNKARFARIPYCEPPPILETTIAQEVPCP
ncbi:MAG: hypothetical protein HY040_24050 [Planctomycetes bacterium]|nr:hypothetical protein [Planctomycetota bacterium]